MTLSCYLTLIDIHFEKDDVGVFETEFSVERSNSSTGSTPEWKKMSMIFSLTMIVILTMIVSLTMMFSLSMIHTCQLSRFRRDSPDFTTWKKPFPLSRSGKQKHYKIPILKKVTRLRQLTPDFQPKFKIPRCVLANSQSEIGITSSHYCLLVYTCVACRILGRCELVWFTRFTCVGVFIRLNEEHVLIAINREDGFQVGLFFTQTWTTTMGVTPPKKKNKVSSRYLEKWEADSRFSGWLAASKLGASHAYCRLCNRYAEFKWYTCLSSSIVNVIYCVSLSC